MKKVIFAIAALIAAPVVASEPADLNQLGLGSLSAVSEEAGMEVRGLAGATHAVAVNSMAVMFYDMASGSQFNFETASLNRSTGDGVVQENVTSGAEAAIGSTPIAFTVGDFSASLSQAAVFAGGQSGANSSFSFSLNVPSFN